MVIEGDRTLKAIADLIILSLNSLSAFCQNRPSIQPIHHRAKLKRMMKTAHNSGEFEKLSNYFKEIDQEFRKRRRKQRANWIVLSPSRMKAQSIRPLSITVEASSSITK